MSFCRQNIVKKDWVQISKQF